LYPRRPAVEAAEDALETRFDSRDPLAGAVDRADELRGKRLKRIEAVVVRIEAHACER